MSVMRLRFLHQGLRLQAQACTDRRCAFGVTARDTAACVS